MAENKSPPLYMAVYNQVIDLAMSRHPLSKYVPTLLLLVEAMLCSLIITYVACRFSTTIVNLLQDPSS